MRGKYFTHLFEALNEDESWGPGIDVNRARFAGTKDEVDDVARQHHITALALERAGHAEAAAAHRKAANLHWERLRPRPEHTRRWGSRNISIFDAARRNRAIQASEEAAEITMKIGREP